MWPIRPAARIIRGCPVDRGDSAVVGLHAFDRSFFEFLFVAGTDMRKFRWPWRVGVLDAAGKEVVRTRLGEIDYELKQIMSDVARVSVSKDGHVVSSNAVKTAFTRRDPAE